MGSSVWQRTLRRNYSHWRVEAGERFCGRAFESAIGRHTIPKAITVRWRTDSLSEGTSPQYLMKRALKLDHRYA